LTIVGEGECLPSGPESSNLLDIDLLDIDCSCFALNVALPFIPLWVIVVVALVLHSPLYRLDT